MSATQLAATIALAVIVGFVVLMIVSMVTQSMERRAMQGDPRLDDDLRADAQRQVGGDR